MKTLNNNKQETIELMNELMIHIKSGKLNSIEKITCLNYYNKLSIQYLKLNKN